MRHFDGMLMLLIFFTAEPNGRHCVMCVRDDPAITSQTEYNFDYTTHQHAHIHSPMLMVIHTKFDWFIFVCSCLKTNSMSITYQQIIIPSIILLTYHYWITKIHVNLLRILCIYWNTKRFSVKHTHPVWNVMCLNRIEVSISRCCCLLWKSFSYLSSCQ